MGQKTMSGLNVENQIKILRRFDRKRKKGFKSFERNSQLLRKRKVKDTELDYLLFKT